MARRPIICCGQAVFLSVMKAVPFGEKAQPIYGAAGERSGRGIRFFVYYFSENIAPGGRMHTVFYRIFLEKYAYSLYNR